MIHFQATFHHGSQTCPAGGGKFLFQPSRAINTRFCQLQVGFRLTEAHTSYSLLKRKRMKWNFWKRLFDVRCWSCSWSYVWTCVRQGAVSDQRSPWHYVSFMVKYSKVNIQILHVERENDIYSFVHFVRSLVCTHTFTMWSSPQAS